MDTEDFIKKARKVHGDKYDYSKVNYVHSKTEVEIICPIHGPFKQIPNSHLSGHGCRECGKLRTVESNSLTKEEFIKRAKEIHGDKYDYSKVNYVNYYTEVEIICPEHGSFKQTPNSHLFGHGCRECGKLSIAKSNSLTKEEFIKRAKEIHGDKYDYSKVNYVNNYTGVEIICPKHGSFKQTPGSHLLGHGCEDCGKYLTTEEFIERAKKIHGDMYDYSKVNYVDYYTEVEIICPKHGSFKQTPNNHLSGHGCPNCIKSKLEREIELYLKRSKISYEYGKTWEWLVYKGNQKADFYLPEYNAVIECDGKQHFEYVKFFHRNGRTLEKQMDMDENKRKLCEEHGIKVYYYSDLSKKNDSYPYPYKVYEDITELFKIIQDDNPD